MPSLQEKHRSGDTTLVRRHRLRALLQAFVQEQAALGVPPKGLEQAFAARLQITPSMLSQIKKARPIGDKLARQIEAHCGVCPGWLDQEEQEGAQAMGSETEEAFVAAARAAWKAANARQKKSLWLAVDQLAAEHRRERVRQA